VSGRDAKLTDISNTQTDPNEEPLIAPLGYHDPLYWNAPHSSGAANAWQSANKCLNASAVISGINPSKICLAGARCYAIQPVELPDSADDELLMHERR
jgi:hypothetical protein